MTPDQVPIALVLAAVVCAAVGLASFAIGFPRAARRWREAMPAPREEAPAEPRRVEAAAPEAAPAVPEPVPAPPRNDLEGSLRKTRLAFVGRLERLVRGRGDLDAALIEEIEGILFGADIGVRTADDLLEAARGAGSPAEVRTALEARALEILEPTRDASPPGLGHPHVVLVVGVNGSGKTTTIAKLAGRWIDEGRSVLVAAADTYRAAAIDQLAIWAERVGADLVRGEPGGDPAAVAFDAVAAAKARGADVVIIDTAGRLQTQSGLMDELTKIRRVVGKEIPEAPHEVLLVLDANTGQNAIRQAQEFQRSVAVTGIALTKLDGTAKGGVVLGVAQEVGLPVRYVGVGESLGDLIDFDPESFVRALFAPTEPDEPTRSDAGA